MKTEVQPDTEAPPAKRHCRRDISSSTTGKGGHQEAVRPDEISSFTQDDAASASVVEYDGPYGRIRLLNHRICPLPSRSGKTDLLILVSDRPHEERKWVAMEFMKEHYQKAIEDYAAKHGLVADSGWTTLSNTPPHEKKSSKRTSKSSPGSIKTPAVTTTTTTTATTSTATKNTATSSSSFCGRPPKQIKATSVIMSSSKKEQKGGNSEASASASAGASTGDFEYETVSNFRDLDITSSVLRPLPEKHGRVKNAELEIQQHSGDYRIVTRDEMGCVNFEIRPNQILCFNHKGKDQLVLSEGNNKVMVIASHSIKDEVMNYFPNIKLIGTY